MAAAEMTDLPVERSLAAEMAHGFVREEHWQNARVKKTRHPEVCLFDTGKHPIIKILPDGWIGVDIQLADG